MNRTLELLTKAQDLIRDPKNWTRGAYARDADGCTVDEHKKQARCFCSLGALYRAGCANQLDENVDEAKRLLNIAAGGELSIISFNDRREHYQVMALWDKAKELASAGT